MPSFAAFGCRAARRPRPGMAPVDPLHRHGLLVHILRYPAGALHARRCLPGDAGTLETPTSLGWVPLACLLKTNVVFTKILSFFYVLSLSSFFLPLTPLSHIWCFNLTRVGNRHMGHRSGGLPSRSRPGRGTPGHGGLPPPRLRLVPRVAAAVAGGGPAGPPPGPLTGRRGRDRGEGGRLGPGRSTRTPGVTRLSRRR